MRASQGTNAASRTTPTASEPTICGLRPADAVAADETPDDSEQAGAGEPETGQVERLVGAVRSRSAAARRERHEPSPIGTFSQKIHCHEIPLDDGAADERAERDGEAADPAPGAEREPALLGRERAAERIVSVSGITIAPPSPCTARAAIERLQRSARAQPPRRRAVKMPSPIDEHPAATEAVAERGAGQQQDGERQRVRVDRPLELLERRVEVVADHRQRRRHDEVVER